MGGAQGAAPRSWLCHTARLSCVPSVLIHPPKPKKKSMPATAKRLSASRRVPAKKPAAVKPRGSTRRAPGRGRLPEWNLADLYAGLDDPRVVRDLDHADA